MRRRLAAPAVATLTFATMALTAAGPRLPMIQPFSIKSIFRNGAPLKRKSSSRKMALMTSRAIATRATTVTPSRDA